MTGLAATFAASLGVLVLALVALSHATAGGTAFTTETLRRSAVAQAAVAVPDYAVVDAQGQVQPLRQLLAAEGKVWIVDFVYTRCNTLCLTLGTVFQQLQSQIEAAGLQDRVGLLSISFDPLRDQGPALADYAKRMGMQPAVWQLVSLRDEADRRRLLDSFGIMVVPAPLGEYEHNAALHLVTPAGQLVQIVALDQAAEALVSAQGLAQNLAQRPVQNRARAGAAP